MIELGVDELTIVLQLKPEIKNSCNSFDWSAVAENIIHVFVDKANFLTIYGEKELERAPPKGYEIAYTFGNHNFYLAIAYHQYQMSMGVIVKFSAQSLDYYCEKSGLKVYELLQRITDDFYITRLSRIDLIADYIDEDIDTTEIYQGLMDKKIGIFREQVNKKTKELSYKKCPMKFRGVIKESDVPTIYIGSVQSNSTLRIYDKKREQIERKGSKFDKAIKCKDWVRFEAVFRNEFAHQLSNELLKIKTDDEFANLIACTLIQKFRFMHMVNGVVDCDTIYSQMLIDCITNNYFTLKSPSSRNYDIAKSFEYLFYGSGLISVLYKIKAIWGDGAISGVFNYINEYLKEWKPNDDCRYWLMHNEKDYKQNYPDFDTFLKQNLSTKL